MNGNGEPLSRAEFWMRIASVCFGLWALMIPLGIAILRNTLNEASVASQAVANELTVYKLLTERRITLLEERQQAVLLKNTEQEQRIGVLERSSQQSSSRSSIILTPR